jgi:hypothetical protein
MLQEQFTIMCKEAAVRLGLDPDSGFESGGSAEVKGVQTWVLFQELTSDSYVMFEVGAPQPELAGDVFRDLLELQGVFVGRFDAMFLIANEGIVFSIRTPIHDMVKPKEYADWIALMADQVLQWRSTVLAGKMAGPAGAESGEVAPSVALLV